MAGILMREATHSADSRRGQVTSLPVHSEVFAPALQVHFHVLSLILTRRRPIVLSFSPAGWLGRLYNLYQAEVTPSQVMDVRRSVTLHLKSCVLFKTYA